MAKPRPTTAPSRSTEAQEKAREEIRALQSELNQAQCLVAQLRDELAAMRRRAQDADSAESAVARLNEEIQRRDVTMEHQRTVAREFQRRFLPPALPAIEGVRFAIKYLPCDRVGGDFYDLFDMGNSCLGMLIADISGYGLAATLITAVAKMGFDTFRQNEYSPRVIMEKTNAQVVKTTLGYQFVTAFLGVLDLETLRLKYVNACHPSPILQRDGKIELLEAEGLCCGIFEEPNFEEKEVQLQVGDRVLLYTRGLVSACNPQGKPFENARLYDYVREHRETPVEELLDTILKDFRAHMAGMEQNDDVILVGVEIVPREAKEERIVIPSDPQQLRRIESLIIPKLEALNYGERALFGVRLSIEEAVVNAIKHGNRMDKAKNVTVAYSVTDRECRISVEDEGEGFDPSAVPDPTEDENLELPHGRGLVLIRAYMDEVTHNKKGNRITMVKKAPWAV